MFYLPDTNFFIHLLRKIDPLRSHYLKAVRNGATFYLSVVVLFELQYGVEKSAFIQSNQARLNNLIGKDFPILPFETADAAASGRIRATLEKQKQTIGPYDTLIAGHALARNLTLITANTREFSRVEGLSWEDWSI